jgi:hypothetical protein
MKCRLIAVTVLEDQRQRSRVLGPTPMAPVVRAPLRELEPACSGPAVAAIEKVMKRAPPNLLSLHGQAASKP